MKSFFVSRRIFLGSSLAIGTGAVFYLNNLSCKSGVYSNDIQVILHLSYHLFPLSKLGPGAQDYHISHYLASVFQDSRILKEDKKYFRKLAKWLEESSFDEYEKSFLNLSSSEKEELLQTISRSRWGENLIYTCLNYIFEAMLSAPIYGSNTKKVGWKWLNHNPGFPQPSLKKDIQYEI